MAQIDPAFDYVMDLEGGGNVHTVEGDPGGTTKWGVTQRDYPNLDIPDLTRDQAKEIFRQDYWDPVQGDDIRSQEIATELVEMAFNTGIPAAVHTAQSATNDVLKRAGDTFRLAVDGIFGPQTLKGLNRIAGMNGIAEMAWDGRFNLRQLKYYRNLDRDLVDRFFVGWTRRVI